MSIIICYVRLCVLSTQLNVMLFDAACQLHVGNKWSDGGPRTMDQLYQWQHFGPSHLHEGLQVTHYSPHLQEELQVTHYSLHQQEGLQVTHYYLHLQEVLQVTQISSPAGGATGHTLPGVVYGAHRVTGCSVCAACSSG